MKIQRIIFQAREQAALITEEIPDTPLSGTEVMGRTLASAVSPGTELAVYRGQLKGGTFPCGSGYAAVFEISTVGPEVKKLKPGDRVFCMGPHASWQRVREADTIPLPDGLKPEEAVFARLMGVSMSTLVTTTARPPARVLVTGLGIVGHLAAQIFASCGYEVLACDPVENRRELAKNNDVRDVRAAIPVDDLAVAGRVALCVECSGHEQAVLDACRVMQKRGEVVLLGVPWVKRTEIPAHDLLHSVFHRYVVLRSGWEWEVPRHPEDFRSGSIQENLRAAINWIHQKRIRLSGIQSLRSPKEAQTAYPELGGGKINYLTAVFDWTRI